MKVYVTKLVWFFALVILLGANLAFAKETKIGVKAGLTEVGVSVLPTFLDAATESITIKFPKELGGGKLKFGGTIDAAALEKKKFVFKTSEKHKLHWNNAFGMSFLDLSDVALNVSFQKGDYRVSLDGMIGKPFAKRHNKKRKVVIKLQVKNKKLVDFSLSLPGTKLHLHSIHEFRRMPGASKFTIAAPTISMHAIYGKVSFLDETVDSLLFYDTKKKGWSIGLRFEKALTLSSLTGHKGSFLDHLGLPKMVLTASAHGVKQPYAKLPLAVQDFYKVDGKVPAGTLTLKSGVNIATAFDPALAPKGLKKALKTLGLGSTVLKLNGTVSGMFSGKPSVNLSVDIDAPKSHSFKFLKMKHAKAKFFIRISEEEAALGFRTQVIMKQGKKRPDLEFDVDFAFAAHKSEAEIMVSGTMKGDWEKAAGIKGLTLENPFMSVGINETGSFDMLIDGTILIGHEKIRAAADLVLSPEALGLPTAFAFAGEISKIKLSTLSLHAQKHSKLKHGGFKDIEAEFRDVAFAYMTPGAHLPADLEKELNISGAGMALKATLLINGKELGEAKGYFSTKGIKVEGKLDPFKLGPLQLKETDLAIQAGAKLSPKFSISGDLALFKGFKDKFSISLQPSNFSFYTDTKFGGAFEVIIHAESKGLSLKKSNDFKFDAELDAKYSEAFKKLTKAAIKGLKKEDEAIKKAKSKLAKAQKSVNGLKSNLKREREKTKKALDAATKSIDSAKHKVDKLKDTIRYNKKKAHSLHKKAKKEAKHFKLAKAARHKAEEAAIYLAMKSEEAALKTAKWSLNTAKKSVNIVPVDSAPKVIAIAAELKTAQAGLVAAQGFLSGILSVNKGIEKALEEIDKGLHVLEINKLAVSGSLRGIVSLGKAGTETKLVADVNILKKRHVFHQSLKIDGSKFNKFAKNLAKHVADEIVKAMKI
ncbi:MAG: hypothetical protein GY777_22320 [Candidatus Brocadiaceae bacterium]|nr:hypothetical protein [Candidatus Brocadiaceae bacterium]